MKTAVIYARYSSERQTEQSIEGQLRVCNEYAERNDIVIVDTYIDRAMTGTNDNRITYIKIEPKTTYKIEKTINDHFGVGLSTEEPVIGTVFNSYSNDETLSEVTVTSGESDNYLAIYYWTKYDTGTEEEIRKSIVVTKVLI